MASIPALLERSSRRLGAPRLAALFAAFVVAAVVPGLIVGTAGAAIVATVPLGTAAEYSVLAGTTVTNTGPSTLAGSLGVSPGSAVTGFPPGIVTPPATIQAATAAAANAQSAVTAAYNNAAGRPINATVPADLAGSTLVGGVYAATSNGPLSLNGTLTLDGGGDPSSVFIFQTGSTLITGSSSRVVLINGAQECNVFWQVGSSATLGTASTFRGTILALTSITVTTGATVHGRALARNGAVTLDSNVFVRPTCDLTTTTTAAPPTTAAPTTTTTVDATTTSTLAGATTTVAPTSTIAPTTTVAPAGTTSTLAPTVTVAAATTVPPTTVAASSPTASAPPVISVPDLFAARVTEVAGPALVPALVPAVPVAGTPAVPTQPGTPVQELPRTGSDLLVAPALLGAAGILGGSGLLRARNRRTAA